MRDVSQACTQSSTILNRDVFVRPPKELKVSKESILQVVRSLYGIPEAGNHWFNTYHKNHVNNLHLTESSFDPCLLYNCSKEIFGVVGLQTDDTLFIGNKEFAIMEEKQLCLAKIEAKPCEMLTVNNPITFNGGVIIMENHSILLSQSSQFERIKLLSIENGSKEEYVSQRAHAAYVAITCQPQASFDLSFAAQKKILSPKILNV